ncbi:hypothetical protein HYH03_013801 [Edaphochlamys debaryana]|uniref:Ubiquitin-like domain-containing protein n=1 Tax=Edaphochlamys debaryana TaxID=47281 RepID=A0A835XVB6_9CHLO|nr:hypothetical protein HYH03_013801 [Edaphochlamys debaryana]|eukprot:KAG2487520.1 hypothetical protein HYH03_013801 [Edaphochlamys debaryana]
MLASERGHPRVVRLLLEAGADVKATTKDGDTALSLAATEGHAEVVRLLVEAGADVNAADQGATAPLAVGAHRGHTEVVRALLRAGAKEWATDAKGNTALHLAAAAGREEAVEALLQASTDHSDWQNKAGYTALHLACEKGHLEVVRRLLSAASSAVFSLQTLDGRHTPMDLAVASGHVKMLSLMRKAEEERLPRFRVRVYILEGPNSCRLKEDPIAEFSPSEDVDERRSGTTCLHLSQLGPALEAAGIPDDSARVLRLQGYSCGSLGQESSELQNEGLRGEGVEVAFHYVGEPGGISCVSLVLLDRRQPPPRIPLELRGPWGVRTETLQADVTSQLETAVWQLLPEESRDHILHFRMIDGTNLRPSTVLLDSPLGADHGIVVEVLGPAEGRVHIKSMIGATQAVPVRFDMFVVDLKEAVHRRGGPPPNQLRLVANREVLEDGRTLASYGLQDGSSVTLLLNLTGGKPVICIWAADPMDLVVRLQLSYRWAFSSLVPRPDVGDGKGEWGTGGRVAEWRVAARPDGSLAHPGSGGREYSYLFWEAMTEGAVGVEAAAGGRAAVSGRPALPGLGPTPPDLPLPDFTPSRSFCVSGAEAEAWLYAALQAFGVPTRERTDFLTFWLPHMAGAPWLLLSFAAPSDYQAAAALSVSPAPDALVRVFLMWERLAAPVAACGSLAAEAARVGVLRREGARLAVLEWGGMEVVRPRAGGGGARALGGRGG